MHKSLKEILKIFIVSIIYVFSRVQNLTAIPVFGDEAIYIRWSQIIKSVETLRFLPLTDGKQPLFMWLTVPFLAITKDPLFAGRLLSVLAGLGIIIGIYLSVRLLTNKNIALLSSIMYILLPFSFFFDRMALADNLLSMFAVWSLYLCLLISKYPRIDLSMILGIILGLAWITKSPAIYFIVLSFATIIYKQPKKYYLAIISIIFAFVIYNLLRLGPQFHMIALRNKDYVWPVSEILKHPLDPLKPHIIDIFNIYIRYIGFPIILLFFTKFNLIILAWYLLPLFATSIIAKVFTARYILFSLPYLIILMSFGLSKIKNKIYWLLLVLSFIPNIIFIYKLSTNPFHQKLTSTETAYLNNWTSGWGIKEVSIYLKDRAKVANVIVGTEGYFGTLPDGLQIYAADTKQLTMFGVGVNITEVPAKLIDAYNHGDEVYLLFNQSRLKIPQTELDKLTLVKKFLKPDNDYLVLYKL